MKLFFAAIIALGLVGCDWVQVPPAKKGKILTTAGYTPEVLQPGKYTLYGRDSLVLLDTGTQTAKESMSIIMQDKLTLEFDVRFRTRIGGSDTIINAMFDDITPINGIVQLKQVYDTYGKMLVRNQARSVVGAYTVEDVHKNYSRISNEIAQALTKAMKSTPLEFSDVALGNIKYPDVITKAVEANKERELFIKKEQAQAEIDLLQKTNQKRIADADYEVQITKAKTVRDQNKLIADGVTPALLEYRKWEVIEKLQDNQNVVFMPIEGLASTGAQVRMFNAK